MPQFDFYSFPQQLVFLILSFMFVYTFVLRTFLPEIATVLKFRAKLSNLYVTHGHYSTAIINYYYSLSFFAI